MQRLNLYLQIIFWLLCAAAIVLFFRRQKTKSPSLKKGGQAFDLDAFLQKYHWYFFAGILLIGVLIRFVQFPHIPAGFNQDEAAIAYDSYSILHFGVDRNGYHLPVYPVSWGAGQGPFYLYFAIPFMWLFGDGVFGFRIGNVLLSIASVICVFLMMKKTLSVKAGLCGMLLFAVAPWNVFLSRWSLDANPLPSLFLIGVCLFLYAVASQKTAAYLCAAAVLSITLYTYGTSYVVIPLFLVLAIPYLLYHKKISLKQTLLSGLVFCIVAFPLFLFILVNYFHMDEIVTSFFSVPKLTELRSSAVFKSFEGGFSELLRSFSDYFQVVILQKPDWAWNSVADYGIIYLFSLPLILLGIVVTICKTKIKTFSYTYFYAAMFVAASVLVLLVHPNVNRIHIMFVPVLCMMAIGIVFLCDQIKWALPAVSATYLIAFCLFFGYYTGDYNQVIGPSFFESFDEAIVYATEHTDGRIYVTEKVNGNYLLTLFYTKYDPIVFHKTVQYDNVRMDFRQAQSFGRYVFSVPQFKNPNASFVVPNDEVKLFNESFFDVKHFTYYSVLSPKSME